MTKYYEINHGSYYLYDKNRINLITKEKEIILMTDTVALCFDKENLILHKHGKPETVKKWYEKQLNILKNTDASELIENLVIVDGPFPVEEINKILINNSYLKDFYNNLMSNNIKPSKNILPF